MRRLIPALLALGVLGLTFGLAACGDDDDGGGGDVSDASFDLQIGALVPLTGDLAQFGPPGEKAAELGAEEAQKALDDAGADIKVSLESSDTQTQPQAAQSAAEQLISGGASCLVGPWASSETVPVGRSVAARQQVPLISPSSTSPEITELPDDGYVFRTAPSDALQGLVLADAVEEDLGSADGTVALAARNDPYGEGIVTEFAAAWEEKGGTVTGPVLYDLELSSYNSEADEIVADNPDRYVIIDFEEPYNAVGAALARTGDFDAANLWTADGLAFEDGIPESIPTESLASAQGTRPSTPEDTETAKAFDDLYKSAGGEKARGTFDSQNFDAVTLCALAAVAAGSSEGSDIAEQIPEVAGPPGDQYDYTQMADAIQALRDGEDIDFQGVSGPLDLDENGDPTIGFYEVYSYDADGGFKVEEFVEQEAE